MTWYSSLRCWTSGIFLIAALIALILPTIMPFTKCALPSKFNLNTYQAKYTEELCMYSSAFYQLTLEDSYYFGHRYGSFWSSLMPTTSWAICLLVLMAMAVHLPFVVWSGLDQWFGNSLDSVISALAKSSSDCKPSPQVKRRVKSMLLTFKTGCHSNSAALLLLRKVFAILVTVALFTAIQIIASPFSANVLTQMPVGRSDQIKTFDNCNVETKDGTSTIPCLFPVNQVLLQLFIILSMFLIVALALYLADLALWIVMLAVPSVRNRKVVASIREMEAEQEEGQADQTSAAPVSKDQQAGLEAQFASFLGLDGFLLLILAKRQEGQAAWDQLLQALWEEFKIIQAKRAASTSEGGKAGVEEADGLLDKDKDNFQVVPLSEDVEGQPSPDAGTGKMKQDRAEFVEEKKAASDNTTVGVAEDQM